MAAHFLNRIRRSAFAPPLQLVNAHRPSPTRSQQLVSQILSGFSAAEHLIMPLGVVAKEFFCSNGNVLGGRQNIYIGKVSLVYAHFKSLPFRQVSRKHTDGRSNYLNISTRSFGFYSGFCHLCLPAYELKVDLNFASSLLKITSRVLRNICMSHGKLGKKFYVNCRLATSDCSSYVEDDANAAERLVEDELEQDCPQMQNHLKNGNGRDTSLGIIESHASPGTGESLKMDCREFDTKAGCEVKAGKIAADTLAEVLNRQKDSQSALNIFKWARDQEGFDHSPIVYNALVGKLSDARMFTSAWHLLEEMQRNGCKVTSETVLTIFKSYGSAGWVKAAVNSLEKMKKLGLHPTVEIYNYLLKIILNAKHHQKALLLYQQMLNDGLSANESVFSTLICGLCQVGHVDEGWKLFTEMEKKGLSPTLHIYTSLIKGMCMHGKLVEARGLLKEVLEVGFKPNVITYNVVINALCRDKRTMEAYKLFIEMKTLGCDPDVVTYNILLHCYLKLGRLNRGLGLYKQMLRAGCSPDVYTDGILLIGLSRAGKFSKAIKYLNARIAEGRSIRIETYNIMLHSLCQNNLAEAEMFLKRMIDEICVFDVVSYSTLMHSFCKVGRLDEAEKLLSQMKTKGLTPTAVSYEALISGFCKSQKLQVASKLLKEMLQEGCGPNPITCKNLLHCFSREGMVDDALKICDQIVNRQFLIDPDGLGMLLKALRNSGRNDEGQKLLRRLSSVGCLPEPYESLF